MQSDSSLHRSVLRWGLIFAGWTALALLFMAPDAIRLVRANKTSAVWSIAVAELICSYLWLALTPLVVWWGRVFRIKAEKKLRTVAIHLVSSGALLFVHSALFFLISIPFEWYHDIVAQSIYVGDPHVRARRCALLLGHCNRRSCHRLLSPISGPRVEGFSTWGPTG